MAKLSSVPQRFLEMSVWHSTDEASGFANYHLDMGADRTFLTKFLTATMDEVRLFYAERYAEDILRINYTSAWKYFRRAVLLREITGLMEFERQRDHAAHTLHNYLLGWYIFAKSPVIRSAAESQFQRFNHDESALNWRFGQMWPTVSLLHDVGYLFEGSLHVRDVSHSNANLAQGAEYVSEYFRHNFWNSHRVRTQQEIDRVLELTNVSSPRIKAGSISEVVRSLRTIPSFSGIMRQLELKKADGKFRVKPDVDFSCIQPDCYRLWSAFYASYGQIEMAKRIDALEKAEHILMSKGIPGFGIRIIDHGLAGAMLLLQAATIWYEICCSLPEDAPADKLGLSVWNCFRTEPDGTPFELDPRWYWNGLLWSTAAVAMHNVAQSNWPGAPNAGALRITLDDDFLSYLGILVDILEEWDRYTMRRDSIFAGETHLPVQAQDVRMGISSSGQIVVEYPTKKCADKVRKALEEALIGWTQIVKIQEAKH